LAEGLRPDPLGSLQHSPDPLPGLRGWGPREGEREKGKGREEGEVRREGGREEGRWMVTRLEPASA